MAADGLQGLTLATETGHSSLFVNGYHEMTQTCITSSRLGQVRVIDLADGSSCVKEDLTVH
jgi:hypothetical protein